MSAPLFQTDLVFYQRLLASMGYYTDTIDGDWGPNTEAADQAFEAASLALRQQFGELDSRSEGNIVSLHIKAQQLARQFMADLAAANFGRTVRILSGTRTYEEQNRLYAKGRSEPGPIVTNAQGGSSNHNFGIAWDIGIFDGGVYYTGANAAQNTWYSNAAATASMVGLDWGGNWSGFTDLPHYEVTTGMSITQKRDLFESGNLAL